VPERVSPFGVDHETMPLAPITRTVAYSSRSTDCEFGSQRNADGDMDGDADGEITTDGDGDTSRDGEGETGPSRIVTVQDT
jgi:hypothetical protein